MKQCKKCIEFKSIDLFYKNNSICKNCHKQEMSNYRRTKEGVATSVYNTQCSNSIKRGHKKPSYSKKEFTEWLFNHKKFNKLYSEWVKSGYNRNLKPSPDRINNDLGYSFDNLKLVTCIENIRGKRVQFKKKDYQFLFMPKWRIEGYDHYYFTTENELFNTNTNRLSKKVVRCYSVGYNLDGKFITLKKLKTKLIKIKKTSSNNLCN